MDQLVCHQSYIFFTEKKVMLIVNSADSKT